MTHQILNPGDLHNPVSFGYSHLAVTHDLVFVAGQYASDAQGHVTSTDFTGQVRQAFRNLRTALTAADVTPAHVVQLRTYVVDLDTDKLRTLVAQIEALWGKKPPTQTLLGVAGLALPGMLFEVEAIAVTDDSR
ncbi:RidA family protein [Nesterenkonia ebinurensis]|uniref:RidA family protein n=1 Tax=Nesterenkonia ebinurensis TaxID=2608252 RepID=UPI00123DBD3F|nr:RidA family protein [Nesterenkonia ebinurensis]